MNLHTGIESYVSLKRSLGAVFRAETRILHSFGRTLGDTELEAVTPEACDVFCRGTGPLTRWWERKYYTLRGFFAFLVSRDYLASSPLPECHIRVPTDFEPYFYSRAELQRLLDATSLLANYRSRLAPLTFRTLLLVLYGAGLRPSEGLRLRCCDVDLNDHVLAIWDTKFFKSRLVPIGSDLVQAAATYRTARCAFGKPA